MRDPMHEREHQHQGDVCLEDPANVPVRAGRCRNQTPSMADLQSHLNDHVHQALLLVGLDREAVVILASEGF